MTSSNSVLRRYTPPTCTLEIQATGSPLTRWMGRPAVRDLQFLLHLDDPRLPEDKRSALRGNKVQLEALKKAVEDYIREFLSQPSDDTVDLIPRRGAVEQNGDFAASLPDSGSKIYLEPDGLLAHILHLGSLATPDSRPFVRLSTLQLFDLATAFEQYDDDLVALPTEKGDSPGIISVVTGIPTWAKAAAGLLLLAGAGVGTWKLIEMNQPLQTATNSSPAAVPNEPSPIPASPSGTPLPTVVLPTPQAGSTVLPTPPSGATPTPGASPLLGSSASPSSALLPGVGNGATPSPSPGVGIGATGSPSPGVGIGATGSPSPGVGIGATGSRSPLARGGVTTSPGLGAGSASPSPSPSPGSGTGAIGIVPNDGGVQSDTGSRVGSGSRRSTAPSGQSNVTTARRGQRSPVSTPSASNPTRSPQTPSTSRPGRTRSEQSVAASRPGRTRSEQSVAASRPGRTRSEQSVAASGSTTAPPSISSPDPIPTPESTFFSRPPQTTIPTQTSNSPPALITPSTTTTPQLLPSATISPDTTAANPTSPTNSDLSVAARSGSPTRSQPSDREINPADAIPQVTQARAYFRDRWRPPAELNQDIEYSVTINPDGTIRNILPRGQAAEIYQSRTDMPMVGDRFVSPLQNGRNATIVIRLLKNGTADAFLESN